MNSPLLLERYYLTAVHLESNDALQVKELPEFVIDSSVSVASHSTDERRWKVMLTVSFRPTNEAIVPYKGSVSFTGFFAVDPAYPLEKVKLLVETNAPSVLYGAAREMCSNLTSRGPWPFVMLPTQSFYKIPAPQEVQTKPAADPELKVAPGER